MRSIAIYGAGGFGREVRGMLDTAEFCAFAGYLDDFKTEVSLNDKASYDDVLLAIANPATRERTLQNWSRKAVAFNSFISDDIRLHPSVKIGRGCILCPGVQITVDVIIGSFVIVNLNSTIGHDVVIGCYSSLMPSVNISGNVEIGKRVFIGSGATILQGVAIGDDAIVGAGSVVTTDVGSGEIVMGVPAKVKRK